MTKQNEIREGIHDILCDPANRPVHCWVCRRKIDHILSYLHSQGVVIKVDRELPEVDRAYKDFCGFVAWEPLIKEDKVT